MQPQAQSQAPAAIMQRVPPPPHTNPAPANFPPPYRSPPNPNNSVNTTPGNPNTPNGSNAFSKLNVSEPNIGYRHTLTGENGQQMQNSLKDMMLLGNKNQTLDSVGQSIALQQLRNGPQTQNQAERLQNLQSRLPLPGDTYVSPDHLRDAANRMFSRNHHERSSFSAQPYGGDAGFPPSSNGAASRSVRDTINSRMAKQQQQQQQHQLLDDSTNKRNSFANHSFRQATEKLPPPQVPPKPHSRSTSRERLGEEVDNLDAELKHILRSEGLMSPGQGPQQRRSNGLSSTPPLPALSPGPTPPESSPGPKQVQQHKPDLLNTTSSGRVMPKSGGGGGPGRHRGTPQTNSNTKGLGKSNAAPGIGALSLDLESVLGLQTQTDLTSDESTTVDLGDATAIRKQLDGLENMYSEVLKLLGVRKYGRSPYGYGDKRTNRKMYGSMSSLPSVSSIGSRHFYKDKGKAGGSSRPPKDRNYNKRFQRLESHVVTLARSVAHLSSEMRTQSALIQEIEALRQEMQQLRGGVPTAAPHGSRMPPAFQGGYVDPESFFAQGSAPPEPHRVRVKTLQEKRVEKLKSFFGDEPPLLRLFLKNLGYEKYASAFEEAKIGLLELPCLSEESLEQLGVPMGPRNRILQEAKTCIGGPMVNGNLQNQGNSNYSFYII